MNTNERAKATALLPCAREHRVNIRHCPPDPPPHPYLVYRCVDLAKWVDEAGEAGFIFFSLGSAVKPSDLPETYRKVLVNVFASLRQRVLWKWDEEGMADLPPNVRLGKWLPQQDILGHPRLRLFITHGGLLSTLESTYHGAPVLGVPVFGDQVGNMVEVQRQGWGRALRWGDFGEEVLRGTIHSIMDNPEMQAVVARRSALMRDLPVTPAREVSYWVSYVVRHGGARHLRSPLFALPCCLSRISQGYQLISSNTLVAAVTYLRQMRLERTWFVREEAGKQSAEGFLKQPAGKNLLFPGVLVPEERKRASENKQGELQ
ncbi:hypothetical protein C7M84_010293 [Penaeus vannamei]|uniref:UDP-glucuronosyltransferase n=1 Tax=Penaeus vannamei TaxID=6689 RepID=A0A3R7MAG8_PENVA|nr:hypothetical protein C7M84_010293 [Penaeus vannamei]